MSVQRSINSKFWSDTFVVENLNPLDRYLFLYFLTNERTNLSGVYEAPMRIISNETGLDRDEITRMLDRLKGKVEYKDGWVCLVNFIKHQNIENSSIRIGINNKLDELPEKVREWACSVRQETSGIPEVYERGTSTDKEKERKGKEIKGKERKETKAQKLLSGYEDLFQEFWKEYPLKVGKGLAYETWNLLSDEIKRKCIEAIKNQVANKHFYKEWKKEDTPPHPTTWLNQKRWEDEVKGKKVAEVVKLTSK